MMSEHKCLGSTNDDSNNRFSAGASYSKRYHIQRDFGSNHRHGSIHGADGDAHHSSKAGAVRRSNRNGKIRLRYRFPTRQNGQSSQGIQTHDW